MRYDGKKLSGKGHTLYSFAMNSQELFTVKQILDYHYRMTPDTPGTHVFRTRVRSMSKEIGHMVYEEKLVRPLFAHDFLPMVQHILKRKFLWWVRPFRR